MKPPQPKKIQKIHTAHGDKRVDNYTGLEMTLVKIQRSFRI